MQGRVSPAPKRQIIRDVCGPFICNSGSLSLTQRNKERHGEEHKELMPNIGGESYQIQVIGETKTSKGDKMQVRVSPAPKRQIIQDVCGPFICNSGSLSLIQRSERYKLYSLLLKHHKMMVM